MKPEWTLPCSIKVFNNFPINSIVLYDTNGGNVNNLKMEIGYGMPNGLPDGIVPAIVRTYTYNNFLELVIVVENIVTNNNEEVHPTKLLILNTFNRS